MKICRKCDKNLPLGEYYTHPQMADGHLNMCKSCTKKRVHKHRYLNLDKIQEYDRQRGQLEHRKQHNKTRNREHYSNHPSKVAWIKRNKFKRAAQIKVGNAIRNGRLIKMACRKCGNPKSEAHHEDYNRPLDVIWLCKDCHGARHREINEYLRRIKKAA